MRRLNFWNLGFGGQEFALGMKVVSLVPVGDEGLSTGMTSSPTKAIWTGPEISTLTADIFVVLIALALPWSTSLVAIFAVIWLLTLVPTFDRQSSCDC